MLNILVLVNKRYALLILGAFVTAIPVAYYLLNDWLNSFQYQISIRAGPILFSGLLAGVIGIASICG